MNASHNCLNVKEAKVLIATNAVFAAIGALANLLAILIIFLTRSHHQHVHRLTLYLGLLGLTVSVLIGFETLPVDIDRSSDAPAVVREGWNCTCAAIGFVTQHLALSKALANLGVCFYIFTVAMFPRDARLQQRKFEVAGVVVTLVLPAVITWVPFVTQNDGLGHGYGLNGAWCWIREDCAAHSFRFMLALTESVDIVPHAISLVLICIVAGRLCTKTGKVQQTKLCSALKEVLPLSCFPTLEALALVVGASRGLGFSTNVGSNADASTQMIVVCLLQTVSLVLPLSLWLHPSVRHRLYGTCARWRGQQQPQTLVESSATTTVDDTSMARRNQLLSCSETDSLINHHHQ